MNGKEFEKKLWSTAKRVGKGSTAEEAIHLVLGLIFLRYVTDTSLNETDNLSKGGGSSQQDEYLTYNEYFVPKNTQWSFLQKNIPEAELGKTIDHTIDIIEELNNSLKKIFLKNYAHVDPLALKELIDLIGQIRLNKRGQDKRDFLANAFDFLLKKFAENSGKNSGLFYAPESISKLVTEMIEPRQGKVYDACCGAGSMFVQSSKFIRKYRGKEEDVSFYGQDNNSTIQLARMNVALNGLKAHVETGDAFTNDPFSHFTADYVSSIPSSYNTTNAWVRYYTSKLSSEGIAGIVLRNDSLNTKSEEEKKIRKDLIEAGLVDCIVALPSHLFYSSDRAFCIWILSKNRTSKYRNRDNEVLFIDAHRLKYRNGNKVGELTDEHILLISRTYHRWRNINGDYIDIKGFCKAISVETISKNRYSLIPRKYVSSSKTRKAIPAVLLIIFLALLYFLFFNKSNNSTAINSAKRDTVLTVQPPADSKRLPSDKKAGKPVNSKVTSRPAIVIDTVSNAIKNTTAQQKRWAETKEAESVNNSDSSISYKVISKAYFYNRPDERTRRNAFITHWNNSYANIRAIDEKNGFIYVTFINHLHQTSTGWLRKKDLKEVNQ